jgi:hypothetical protein
VTPKPILGSGVSEPQLPHPKTRYSMTIIIVRTAVRLNGEDVCEAFLVAQYVKIHCRGW